MKLWNCETGLFKQLNPSKQLRVVYREMRKIKVGGLESSFLSRRFRWTENATQTCSALLSLDRNSKQMQFQKFPLIALNTPLQQGRSGHNTSTCVCLSVRQRLGATYNTVSTYKQPKA